MDKFYAIFILVNHLSPVPMTKVHYHLPQVEIVKPLTSKSGNSETYTLCTGFKGCSEEELACLKQRHTLEEPTASLFARFVR